MKKLFTLLLLSHCLFFEYPAASREFIDKREERSIWLEYGKQLKKKDGTIVQVLWIKSNFNSKNEKTLFSPGESTAIYRVDKKLYYSVPINSHNNKAHIKIKAGKASFIEVCLTVREKDTVYTAETSFYLFGKSGKETERENPAGKPVLFPIVSILSPAYNYWPQTGEEYTFKVNSGKDPGKSIKIKAIDKKKISPLNPRGNGEFTYTPPHDRDLDTQSAGAYKGNIIQIKEKRGSRMYKRTYTLLLHRSRYAYLHLKSGLLLVSGTMAFFLSLVIFTRRKKYPQRA